MPAPTASWASAPSKRGALLSHASDQSSWTGDYRRGYFDLIFPGGLDGVGLPSYQDGLAAWRGSLGGGQARLMVFGSQDSLSTLDGGVTHSWESAFATLGAGWEKSLGDWHWDAKAASSYSRMLLDLGPDLHLTKMPYEWLLAVQGDAQLEGGHAVNVGAQWHQTRTILDGAFDRLPVELGSDIALNSLTSTTVNALGSKAVSSVWAQDRWQLLPATAMTFGARIDQVDLTGEWHASPRWALEWKAWEGGTWRAAVGDYFQSPDPLATVPGWTGVPPTSSLVRDYTASYQQALGKEGQLRLEAYHKDFEQGVPETTIPTGLSGSASTITLNAATTGWAEGAELWIGLPQAGPWSAWASYAWSSTLRSAGQGYYDADFSQPHVGNLALQWHSTHGLTLGGRLRLATGIPYTPIASRTYDPSTGTWTPTFGATNSQRLPSYQRVDLRAEQAIPSSWGRWKLFVELFNATDAFNVTSVTYKDDYSGIQLVRQFPRFLFGGGGAELDLDPIPRGLIEPLSPLHRGEGKGVFLCGG